MLKIHVLNVAHGDSIVLEFDPGDVGEKDFAVIDCNGSGDSNAALQLLRNRGARSLRFIALTHPHADHYYGLGELCEAYEGRIEAFLTFPLDRTQDRLATLLKKYVGEGKIQSEESSAKVIELLKFFLAARKQGETWECPVASNVPSRYAVSGFPGVQFEVLLPGANAHQVLDGLMKGKIPTQSADVNDLSIALSISYAGQQIVLGADATVLGWGGQSRRWHRHNFALTAGAVKLPHHGSEKDCANSVLDILFAPDKSAGKIAVISAGGTTHHPNADVLRELARRGIKPYCTNLAVCCGGAVKKNLTADNPEVSPELLRNLQPFIDGADKIRPCQGNVTLVVDSGGSLTVERQYQTPCGFRQEWPPYLEQSLSSSH